MSPNPTCLLSLLLGLDASNNSLNADNIKTNLVRSVMDIVFIGAIVVFIALTCAFAVVLGESAHYRK